MRHESDFLRPLLPAATNAMDENDRIALVVALGIVEDHFAGVVLFFGEQSLLHCYGHKDRFGFFCPTSH
jgi:hypothetical protein